MYFLHIAPFKKEFLGPPLGTWMSSNASGILCSVGWLGGFLNLNGRISRILEFEMLEGTCDI